MHIKENAPSLKNTILIMRLKKELSSFLMR